MFPQSPQEFLKQAWWAGVMSVQGRPATRAALEQDANTHYDAILAVGKAASSMCLGAMDVLPNDIPALVVTKYDHVDTELIEKAHVEIIQSAHPTPDQNSLIGGKRAIEFVSSQKTDARLLVLVSGGASSLVEDLVPRVGLSELQKVNNYMHSAGWDIVRMNQLRTTLSNVKGGKLLTHFSGEHVTVLAISDVPGDDINVIASGIGNPVLAESHQVYFPESLQDIFGSLSTSNKPVSETVFSNCIRVIGSNQVARNSVVKFCKEHDISVKTNEESLYKDIGDVAADIVATLMEAETGIYIWGGEPTVTLPASPGKGGRNQSLALLISAGLAHTKHITILVAGTDGSDGPTNAAGGMVSTADINSSVADTFRVAVNNADAYPLLEANNQLFVSEPTGTNVMDLVIVFVD